MPHQINELNIIGDPFIELTEVNSTNSYAIDRIQANLAAHGMACFAHHQTAGKGQRGKQWEDETGANIILSVVIDATSLALQQQFMLSATVALGCYDFFASYAGEETTIKWPNDIYWRDRKAAGILIENIIQGNYWKWAVIGIGMNINQTNFAPTLKNPVSLKQITGNTFTPVTLAKELCTSLQQRLLQLYRGEDAQLLQAYNLLLYKKGHLVKLKKEAAAFNCTIQGVNAAGQLLVQGAAQESFGFGEVVWVV